MVSIDQAQSKIKMSDFVKTGLNDIIAGANKFNMAFYFAWGDTKSRYRRSVLGPFWIVLSTAITVAGLGFLWSMLLKQDPSKLVPSLTVGLVIWQFLAACILESSGVFIRNAHFIKNMSNPYFFFPLHLILRHIISLGHNFIVIVLVLLYFKMPLSLISLMVIPGLFLVIGNLLWLMLLIGIVGARFRDTEQIVGAIMPLLFFISPVIYRPDFLTSNQQHIVWLNPFSYLIALIRDPLIGNLPPLFVYGVSILSLVIGTIFVSYQLGKKQANIAFWV